MRLVGAATIPADGRTDGRTDRMNLTGALVDYANTTKNCSMDLVRFKTALRVPYYGLKQF